MSARAGRADEERHTMWARIWYALHGHADVTPQETRETLWARLADLEAAAREVETLEDVEAARARIDHDR